jgi:hypothetical protein
MNASLIRVNLTANTSSTARFVGVDSINMSINYTTTSCSGTGTSCNDLTTNPAQCTASGCGTKNATLACFATYCTLNCSIPSGFTGKQDLQINANYTTDNWVMQNISAQSVDYGSSDPCSIACASTTTGALSCSTLTLTGTGTFEIEHAVGYTTLVKDPACVLAVKTGSGSLAKG